MATKSSDEALSLSEIKAWVSEDDHVWIREGDEKEAANRKEIEANSGYNVANLFGADSDSDDDDNGTKNLRVQQWRSSAINPDGIGGFQPLTRDVDDDDNSKEDENLVKLVFILSESYQGFGDTLWSSARHVSNLLANPSKCLEVLAPMFARREEKCDEDLNQSLSPLHGISFLELGAGAGVPSWAAMHCGARVVCTDLSDTNRIRSMAECAERNFRLMKEGSSSTSSSTLQNAKMARVCPHDWGSPIKNVALALSKSGNERYDVIIGADCAYMPWLHNELLDSIDKLLSDIGVALLPFALHGNTVDDDVWKIVDRAKDKGFVVEVLESQQLSPPTSAMDAKQGLVHTVRLTKKAINSA